jgi:hypothetical protein
VSQALAFDQAVKFVEVMKSRLDESTMTEVMAQLLVYTPSDVPRRKTYRMHQFREALGGMSYFAFRKLQREGKIPPGQKITDRIIIWTEEQVAATTAMLVDGREEK